VTAELSFFTVILQILAGVLLAAGVLYAIKGYSQKIRITLTTAALLVAVLVYVLLALFSGNPVFVAVEIIGLLLFLFLIGLGYRYTLWFVAMGWILHVLWDVGLYPAQTAPYVPQWYAWLCVGFDVAMAFYMGTLLVRYQHK